MTKTLQILIIGSDPRLRSEFKAALSGTSHLDAVTHFTPDFRQAVETVRSRRPNLAIVEMTTDLQLLKAFAEEVAVGSPETALVATFHSDVFGADGSESAIIIQAIRAGVQDFIRRPMSSGDLEQLLTRLLREPAIMPGKIGKVISFVSNKGGVGKSTLAVSVACGLAQRHPERVLLIDGSLQMGVCATMLDLRPVTSLTDMVRERDRLDETLFRRLCTSHECGLQLLAAPSNAVEAAEIDDVLMARIVTLARRAFDYVIVDTFPLLDRVMMAVLDLSDRSYVVLESIVPTVLGAVRLLQLLDSLGLPADRQRIVINRYWNFIGHLKPVDVAARLGRDVDHVVPYQKALIVAANIGQPYILTASRYWGCGRALKRIIDEVESFAKPLETARGPVAAPRPQPQDAPVKQHEVPA